MLVMIRLAFGYTLPAAAAAPQVIGAVWSLARSRSQSSLPTPTTANTGRSVSAKGKVSVES